MADTEKKQDEPVVKPVKKAGRPKKEIRRNEQGQRLTKSGSIDRRSETALANLKNSSVYKAIQESKKAREEKRKADYEQALVESESDSGSEYEYDIAEMPAVEIRKPPKEIVVEKVVEKIVPDETVVAELEKTKADLNKIKSHFQFNQHMNKIELMTRKTSIKF